MTNGHFQKCDRPGPIIGDKLLVAGYFLRIISATDHPHIGSWVQKNRKRGQLRKQNPTYSQRPVLQFRLSGRDVFIQTKRVYLT